jgi:chromosome segregation ATPase
MFGNIKLFLVAGAALAVFGLGLYLGHHSEAGKVADLEAQLDSIKKAGSAADEKLKASQQEIDRTLKAKEAEYARQAEQLKTEAERRAKELTAALAGANARIKSLQGQVANIDARIEAKRAELTAQINTASAAEKKGLQDQIDALAGEKTALVARILGNECLTAVVPEEVIRPLSASQ